MKDFRMLKVWELSHKLTLDIYQVTQKFPKEEEFGLKSQIRRSSVSITNNLAEGSGRFTDADFARFVIIAYGSANETDYLLLLSKELNYISTDTYEELNQQIIIIKKSINNLHKRLQQSKQPPKR